VLSECRCIGDVIAKRHKSESDGAYARRIQRFQKWERGPIHTSGGRGIPKQHGTPKNPWDTGQGGTGSLLENFIKTLEFMGSQGPIVPFQGSPCGTVDRGQACT